MLYTGELLFDDSTHESAHAAPEGYGTGFHGRRSEGYGAAVSAFDKDLLIDPSEFQARAEEREANGRQLSQRMITAGLPCKDQSQTEFCWCNAPTHSEEVNRVLQNEPMVILSPASVACPQTNFMNVGGYGGDAIQRLVDFGAVPVEQWPANAIDQKYYTKANMAVAMNYRVAKWIQIDARNINQLCSLLLRDIPTAIGLNWWGHEVTAYDVVWVNGQLGIRCRNSWGMGYGHLGFFTLQGSKMYPDDGVAPVSVTTGLAV